MGVRSAFGSGGRLVLQQPLLFGVAAAVAVVSGVVQLGQFVGPVVQLLLTLVSFALVPFFMGGLYGLADEAFDGRARFGTFLDEGIANYLSLLLGYVLLFVFVFIAGIPIAIVGVILLFVVGLLVGVALLGGGGALGWVTIAVLGTVVVLVLVLPLLAVIAVLQFYDVAIVLEDEAPVESFRRSYRLARSRLANVLGYTIVRAAASFLGSIPVFYYTFSRQFAAFQSFDPGATPGTSPPAGMGAIGSPVEALPFIAASVVLTAVVSAVLYPTHVAYYRELAARTANGGDGDGGEEAAGPGGDGDDGSSLRLDDEPPGDASGPADGSDPSDPGARR